MCTRFYVEPDNDETRGIIEEALKSGLARKFVRSGSAVLVSGEVRPSDVVPVVAPDRTGKRSAFPMRWGFRISERQLIINARTETAGEKPTFKESWERRRCVIPASWYYEWEHLAEKNGQKKTGAKYMFQPRGSSVTWLCGLYRIEDGFPVFAVLTRQAPEEFSGIHDRMPLILPEDLIGEWIRPDADPRDLIRYALTDMVTEIVT